MIGDNSILEVQRIGSVLIHEKILENVLYVPKLRMNLLFVIQVIKRYSFEFNSYSWCIKKGLATLVKGSVKYDLYIMDEVLIMIFLSMNILSRRNS